jgi:hypothetical protein
MRHSNRCSVGWRVASSGIHAYGASGRLALEAEADAAAARRANRRDAQDD